MANIEQIAQCVAQGHVDANSTYPEDLAGKPGVVELVKDAIQQGIPALRILNQGLIAGMEIVGKQFRQSDAFLPDVLISAKAMKAGSELLKPHLGDQGDKRRGTVIIGTVEGDMHDIGKNLLVMMLETAGFNVIDLGINVSSQKFLDTLLEHPDTSVLGISSLLTTTMINIKKTIDLVREANQKVKIIVGGAAVTATFAREIGADGYSADAGGAVDMVKEFVGV